MLSIILIIFTKFIHEFILIRRSCCTSKLTVTCKLLISNNRESIFPAHDTCWSRSGSEESFLFHVVIQCPGRQDLCYLEFHNSLIHRVPARKSCVYFLSQKHYTSYLSVIYCSELGISLLLLLLLVLPNYKNWGIIGYLVSTTVPTGFVDYFASMYFLTSNFFD